MAKQKGTVFLMARRPQYGVGKRRLAHDVGDLVAWQFQRLAVARLIRALGQDPAWRLVVAITPDRFAKQPGYWPQGGGDLGKRMDALVHKAPPGPVVFIGSDLPDVQAPDMRAAFKVLGRKSCVLGPADDGGYWLIGFSRKPRYQNPFNGVRWSHAETLADTVKGLGKQSYGLLDEREDIDTGPAYHRWRTLRRR